MTLDYPSPVAAPDEREPRHPSPIRESLLWRFRDPEDAALLRRLGDLLVELVDESGQFGPDEEEGSIRRALLAAAQNLLLDAATLTDLD